MKSNSDRAQASRFSRVIWSTGDYLRSLQGTPVGQFPVMNPGSRRLIQNVVNPGSRQLFKYKRRNFRLLDFRLIHSNYINTLRSLHFRYSCACISAHWTPALRPKCSRPACFRPFHFHSPYFRPLHFCPAIPLLRSPPCLIVRIK